MNPVLEAGYAPEQGVVSHKALLRRKSIPGTDNALVGVEGASSSEFHSVALRTGGITLLLPSPTKGEA